jgi:hypothetical protein
MLEVSQAFNDAAKNMSRAPKARVTINGKVYQNDDLTSINYSSGSIVENNFSLGSTVSSSVAIEFPEVITTFNQLDTVQVEFGFGDEFVSMGRFKIFPKIEVNRNDHYTRVEAYDAFLFMNDRWSTSITYPTSAYSILAEIMNKYNVTIKDVSVTNELGQLEKVVGDYTNREMIGFIAALVGGYAQIDRDGKLVIKRLPNASSDWDESITHSENLYTITPDEYFLKGLEVGGDKFRVNGLKSKIKTVTGSGDSQQTTETEIVSGNIKGNILELENPFITQARLDTILNKVKQIEFFPYSLEWRGNPALEAGDRLNVVDTTGVKYYVPNLSYGLTFNGGLIATSSGDTEVGNESVSNPPSLLEKVKSDVNKAIDTSILAMQSATGKNTTYYSEVKPSVTGANAAGDLWFKQDGDKVELRVLKKVDDKLEWVLVIGDANQEALKAEVAAAMAELAENTLAVENTTNAVSSAISDMQTEVYDAVTKANEAFESATSAFSNSGTALTTAQNAYAKSVKSSSVTYQISSSGTTVPTGAWITTVPTLAAGQYLWTRTVFTCQDTSTTTAYSVSMKGLTGDAGDKGEDAYHVEISSSQGLQFKNGIIETVLTARVYKGGVDVTESLDANAFRWMRMSDDSESDDVWNAEHFGGAKSVSITKNDILKRATFSCSVNL